MESAASDRELVTCYAREGSETAFRALVARHVNLVFAAAFRQAGDAGVAEEVTQNVFVALARKAPRLAGHETLAGWLHRTAILEAKARLRADLRRQRRELAAAALDALHREGRSAAEDLTPLLDEGLLHLREGDRLALVRALRPVAPEPRDLQGKPPEKVRVFEIAGLQDTVAELRNTLFAELGGLLDPGRLEVFTRSLDGWMSMEDRPGGISTEKAVLAEDHRLRFHLLDDGALHLGYGLSTAQGSLTSVMPADELPPVLVPYLQDWIDHLAAEHAAAQAQGVLPDTDQP